MASGRGPPTPALPPHGRSANRVRVWNGRRRDARHGLAGGVERRVTGGTLALLADVAFGCSVESELPAATPYTTAELSLSFLRPARPGGMLTASGQAIHVGRSVGLSEAFVIEEDSERLLAHGTSRLTIFPPLDPAPDPPTDLEPFEPPEHETLDPYLGQRRTA